MTIADDIPVERVKITRAIFGSRLGSRITSDILFPILDQIEKDYRSILEAIGDDLRTAIVTYLRESEPSGNEYKIYEYDGSKPRGQRSTLIGTHTASAPGEPPATLTGTLGDSIEYSVTENGELYIGVLKSLTESYSDAMTEFEYTFFKWGNIVRVVEHAPDAKKQAPLLKHPVGKYSKSLEEHKGWFADIMKYLRPDIRKRIRKELRKSMNKATRRSTVRKGVIFKVYFT